MSDIKMKKVTDLPEKTAISDNDLIVVGNAGTASLRKTKWSTFWNAILTKIRSTIIVNNKVTTEAGYALDARMGKDFQKQIDDLNTKITAGIFPGGSMFSEKPGIHIYAVDPSHKPTEGLNGLNDYGILIVFETGYARKEFRTALYKTVSSNSLIIWNSYNANSGGGKWEVIK